MNSMADTKRCAACGKQLPRESFYAYKKSPDELSYYCKPCQREWKRKHKDKIKLWIQSNPERVKRYGRRWRRTNHETVRRFADQASDHNREVADQLHVPLQTDPTFQRRSWTQWELDMLEAHADKSDEELARLLKTRSPKAVSIKRSKLRKEKQ